MKNKYLVGNWKMNKNPKETLEYIERYIFLLNKYLNMKNIDNKIFFKDIENIICVPYIDIFYANLGLQDSYIKLGSQDVSKYKNGAHTGEISAELLRSVDITYSIIGHSEKRNECDTDEDVYLKIKRLQENNIMPIICIGETEEERKNGTYLEKIKMQLENILKDDIDKENIIIAYEPIWAIGTGNICDDNEVKKVYNYIKNILKEKNVKNLKILYGGSVNDKNYMQYINVCDGFLVGGASLDENSFLKILISEYPAV